MSRLLIRGLVFAGGTIISGGNPAVGYALSKVASAVMGNPLALMPGASLVDGAVDLASLAGDSASVIGDISDTAVSAADVGVTASDTTTIGTEFAEVADPDISEASLKYPVSSYEDAAKSFGGHTDADLTVWSTSTATNIQGNYPSDIQGNAIGRMGNGNLPQDGWGRPKI